MNNIYISKRIAAVISIVLCAVLYLSFLSAFSTKRDTHICYVENKNERFHAHLNCSNADEIDYETTVYKACKNYKPCDHCYRYGEPSKTTITERNYIIPLLISVPASVSVFLLLTYKKKER